MMNAMMAQKDFLYSEISNQRYLSERIDPEIALIESKAANLRNELEYETREFEDTE